MSKSERREWLIQNGEIFGNAELELMEFDKVQNRQEESDLATISVGCGGWLTVVCC